MAYRSLCFADAPCVDLLAGQVAFSSAPAAAR